MNIELKDSLIIRGFGRFELLNELGKKVEIIILDLDNKLNYFFKCDDGAESYGTVSESLSGYFSEHEIERFKNELKLMAIEEEKLSTLRAFDSNQDITSLTVPETGKPIISFGYRKTTEGLRVAILSFFPENLKGNSINIE